jgi:hypothetical protein
MAYEITPVSQQIKPVSNLSLADMVNIGRGVQSYKSGQIALEQQDVGNLEQRAVADAIKQNPNLFMTDNSLDIEKAKTILPQLAPRTYPDMLQKYTTMSKAEIEAKSAKQGLSLDKRNILGQVFNLYGKAGIKDKETYFGGMDEVVKTMPNDPDMARLVDSYKKIWNELPENTPWDQLAQRGAQTLLNIPQQETAFGQKPGTISTGAATFPTVTTPSVAGQAPRQQVGQVPLATAQLPPDAVMIPNGRVDMNNNPMAWVKDPRTGRVLGEVTISGGLPENQMPGAQMPVTGAPAMNMPQPQQQMPGGPVVGGPMPLPAVTAQPLPAAGQPQPAPALPANAPVRMPAGENASTLEAATNLRLKTRELAQNVGVQQFNSDQIIKLADEVISGKGAGTLANLTGGYAGLNGLGIGGKNATNLQQLGHYMALQTQALTAGTGLGNTDAGRAIGGQIAGDIQWTPEAIKQTARVNRALSTGTELFAQGVDNAFTRSKGNPFAATEFQQRWSTALGNDGINAIRLYDAIRKKDNEAIKEVVTQAGGADSAGYQNLVNKIGQMQKLIGGK